MNAQRNEKQQMRSIGNHVGIGHWEADKYFSEISGGRHLVPWQTVAIKHPKVTKNDVKLKLSTVFNKQNLHIFRWPIQVIRIPFSEIPIEYR